MSPDDPTTLLREIPEAEARERFDRGDWLALWEDPGQVHPVIKGERFPSFDHVRDFWERDIEGYFPRYVAPNNAPARPQQRALDLTPPATGPYAGERAPHRDPRGRAGKKARDPPGPS